MSEEIKDKEELEDSNLDTTPEETDSKEDSTVEQTDEDKYNELNDKYLRLYSDFENYRRRTAKERLDLLKSAGEDILTDLLPVLDDFERALKNMGDANKEVKEGVDLIYNKFKNTLNSKGLEPFHSIEAAFDPDFHEAVTKIPAPSKKMRGKVVDEIEKGYKLNDKVIRFAKVVVGE